MNLLRRQFLRLAPGIVVLGILIGAFSGEIWSQTRTIRVVVTFPQRAGGDLMTRAVADQVSRSRVTSVVAENQANPTATEAVARAAPDGNTLLVINNNFVVDSHFRKLAYDPLTDFEPVCKLGIAQALIVVNTATPYRTLGELISAARDNPGKVTMGGNPRTTTHIGMEAIKLATNVDMPFVPISGGNIGLV